MVTNLYVIFDRIAEEAGPVFEAINDGVALRNFKSGILDKVPPYQRPDYRLYWVGTYDNKTMIVNGMTAQEVLVGDKDE